LKVESKMRFYPIRTYIKKKNENALYVIFHSSILFESEWYKRWTQTLVYLHLRPTELKDVIIRLTVV
jgi:hypothetical protein